MQDVTFLVEQNDIHETQGCLIIIMALYVHWSHDEVFFSA